jgi:hypothetical protein
MMAMIYFGGGRGVESIERAYDVLKNGGFYHQICNMGYGLILNVTSNLVNYYGNTASGLDFVH